jgi:hypothetical protein
LSLKERYPCGISIVDNLVAGEEAKRVGERFECVDGGKDVLEIDCII